MIIRRKKIPTTGRAKRKRTFLSPMGSILRIMKAEAIPNRAARKILSLLSDELAIEIFKFFCHLPYVKPSETGLITSLSNLPSQIRRSQ
jgi:hypothetical protein